MRFIVLSMTHKKFGHWNWNLICPNISKDKKSKSRYTPLPLQIFTSFCLGFHIISGGASFKKEHAHKSIENDWINMWIKQVYEIYLQRFLTPSTHPTHLNFLRGESLGVRWNTCTPRDSNEPSNEWSPMISLMGTPVVPPNSAKFVCFTRRSVGSMGHHRTTVHWDKSRLVRWDMLGPPCSAISFIMSPAARNFVSQAISLPAKNEPRSFTSNGIFCGVGNPLRQNSHWMEISSKWDQDGSGTLYFI